jgi:hypothetical protein
MDTQWIQWGIFLVGYAICSGSNVAYFSFSLRDLKKTIEWGKEASPESPEAKAAKRATALLKHLENPNWTLASILLTNVGFGVQLSQLSDQLFVGILAVLMPIFGITIFGEFFAQATFLRYASIICSVFSPFIWFLKYVTAPISYPLAKIVDALYGREALGRLNEDDLLSDLQLELSEFGEQDRSVDDKHLEGDELRTLMNAVQADDELAREVGEPLDPTTILELPHQEGKPHFPQDIHQFICEQLDQATHPWFVIVDAQTGKPDWILDADGFIRDFYHAHHAVPEGQEKFDPSKHLCPARVYTDSDIHLGDVVNDFCVEEERPGEDLINVDVALIWTDEQRWIVTGGDILGRLLRGVTNRPNV